MVELGLRMLCEAFPQNKAHMEIVSKRYNSRFAYRWQRVIDFLKLHYALSDREEPYWLAQRDKASIPDSLAELLELWKYQSPSRLDLIENEEIFPSASYQYVLYGMGFSSSTSPLRLNEEHKRKAVHICETLQQTKMLTCRDCRLTEFCSMILQSATATKTTRPSLAQREKNEHASASSCNDIKNTSDKKDTSYDRIGFR